jgi:hypothetical protein
MSEGRILKLVERNGRGRSSRAAALPRRLHSQSGCLLSWTNQQPPSTATLIRGAGETDWWTPTRSVRLSSLPVRAPRSTGSRLLVNERVHRDAGGWRLEAEGNFILSHGAKTTGRLHTERLRSQSFYALTRIEYCRNFIFKRHFPIYKIFERSCEIGLRRLTANRISEIFGIRLNKRLRGKLATVIDQIEDGHHVFRAYWKNVFLIPYEKFSRFLRNELCSNNLPDFGLKTPGSPAKNITPGVYYPC